MHQTNARTASFKMPHIQMAYTLHIGTIQVEKLLAMDSIRYDTT